MEQAGTDSNTISHHTSWLQLAIYHVNVSIICCLTGKCNNISLKSQWKMFWRKNLPHPRNNNSCSLFDSYSRWKQRNTGGHIPSVKMSDCPCLSSLFDNNCVCVCLVWVYKLDFSKYAGGGGINLAPLCIAMVSFAGCCEAARGRGCVERQTNWLVSSASNQPRMNSH